MITTNLIVIRHAESVARIAGGLLGHSDPSLSDRGREQAERLARRLEHTNVAAIYTSPLARARETADVIASQKALDASILPELIEVDVGMWAQRDPQTLDDREEFDRWIADPRLVRPPDGESLEEVARRSCPIVASLVETHRGQTVALVTHAVVGRVILCALLGCGLTLVPHLRLRRAGFAVVRFEAERLPMLERLEATA